MTWKKNCKIFNTLIYNSLLSLLFLITVIPLCLWCILKKHSLTQRLGLVSIPDFKIRPFWFHAASMGEINVIYATVQKIREDYPLQPIIITTTSETGQKKIKHLFPTIAFACLLPIDFFPSMAFFILRLRPSSICIVETELWPNLCFILDMLHIPRLLINARISDKSYPIYIRTAWFWKSYLENFCLILARSHTDAERIRQLGGNPASLRVIPHIKNGSLLQMITRSIQPLGIIKKWCQTQPLIVFGSIREKEEQVIIQCILDILNSNYSWKIILAPRHLSRLPDVLSQLKDNQIDYQLKTTLSETNAPSLSTRVVVLDTMGELLAAYQYAELCFVGGTLADYGGHNIVEPVLLQVPVLFGLYISNCHQEAEIILQNQAGIQVSNQNELITTIHRLLAEPDSLHRLKDKSRQVTDQLLKINQQVWEYLQPFIPPPTQE